MKKFFYMAVAAIAALSSCSTEDSVINDIEAPVVKTPSTFTATIEGTGTRTVLGEGNKVNWVKGDKVLMMLGTDDDGASAAYIYEATPGVEASSATLERTQVIIDDPNADKFVMAVYPASLLDMNAGGYIFPATQTYNGEDISFAPMFSMPSFLDSETPNNIVFKNAASLLKITVPSEEMANLTSITVSSDLVMNGEVNIDEEGYMYIGARNSYPDVTAENSKITLNIPSGIAIPEGGSKTFYIAILPMSEHTQEAQADHYGYLQIDVTDGNTTKRMRTTKADGIQVERNKIYPINFSENYVVTAAWETALTLGRFFSTRATSIAIQTGVNVSSYTVDETHKKLNEAGTLWEVLDGQVLKVQTSADKIIAPVNSSGLFRDYNKVESIANLNKLDMSAVTDIEGMFSYCQELKSLDLSSFNTSNVTNMGMMFIGCSNLTEIIGIENFNTSNVTSMCAMFSDCSELTELNVSKFNTNNVTDMNSMFYGCSGLTSLDVSNFVTSNVEDMASMFNGCWALKTLDLSNFNTENVTDMSNMFSDCVDLQTLALSNFNTEKVTDMSYMFNECHALQELNLSSFTTSNETNMEYMFASCMDLESLYLGINFTPSSSMEQIFLLCSANNNRYGLTVYNAIEAFINTINCDDDWQRYEYGWDRSLMHFDGY